MDTATQAAYAGGWKVRCCAVEFDGEWVVLEKGHNTKGAVLRPISARASQVD